MIEYWVKEIKGQLNDIEEISWVNCNIHNPSGIFTIFENNINIQYYALDIELQAIFHSTLFLRGAPA